jgi:hypothetical protein
VWDGACETGLPCPDPSKLCAPLPRSCAEGTPASVSPAIFFASPGGVCFSVNPFFASPGGTFACPGGVPCLKAAGVRATTGVGVGAGVGEGVGAGVGAGAGFGAGLGPDDDGGGVVCFTGAVFAAGVVSTVVGVT